MPKTKIVRFSLPADPEDEGLASILLQEGSRVIDFADLRQKILTRPVIVQIEADALMFVPVEEVV